MILDPIRFDIAQAKTELDTFRAWVAARPYFGAPVSS